MEPVSILTAISSVVSKPFQMIIERVVPDKNKAKELTHDFNMAVLATAGEEVKAFSDRIIAEIKNPNVLRDAVRPIITYASFGLYGYIKGTVLYVSTKVYMPLLLKALEGTPEQVYGNLAHIRGLLNEYKDAVFTEFDFYLLLTVLSFWFGGKLLERFTEKVTGAGGIKALVLGK